MIVIISVVTKMKMNLENMEDEESQEKEKVVILKTRVTFKCSYDQF